MSKLLLFLFAADFNKILRKFFALIFFFLKKIQIFVEITARKTRHNFGIF